MNQIKYFLRKKLTISVKNTNSAENLIKSIAIKYCIERKAKIQELKANNKIKFAEKIKTANAVVCQLS